MVAASPVFLVLGMRACVTLSMIPERWLCWTLCLGKKEADGSCRPPCW